MKNAHLPAELRIALLYALFSAGWILLSDRLLSGLFMDTFSLSTAQTIKGMGFVLLSALLIYLLLRSELARRRQAEADLRANELLFSKIFTSSPVAISMVEVSSGKTIAVNDAWCNLTGYTKEEVLGRDTVELKIFAPEERNRLAQEFSKHGFSNLIESEITTKSGAKKNILITSEIMVRDGQNLVLVSAVDITERKRAEQALRESELLFATIFRSSPIGINLFRIEDGRSTLVNDVFLEMIGYPRIEVEGHSTDELNLFVDPEYRESWIQRLRQGERVFNQDASIRTKTGEIKDVLASLEMIELDGEALALAVLTDITERRNIERALSESESSLKRSQSVAHVGHWTWDTRKNTVHWSDEMQRIFGLDPGAVHGDLSLIIENAIHPEDRARVRALNEVILRDGLAENAEYRVIHPDGSVHYIWAVPGESLKDEHGHVIQLSGIVQDITERKQAEEHTRRQLAYLTALREIDLAINSSSDMQVSLNILVERAITLLEVDAAAVLLLDITQHRLNYAAGQGFRTSAVETASIRLGESYAGKVALGQRQVHILDLHSEPVNLFIPGFFDHEDFVSYSGLPLVAKGEVIGVLELFNRSKITRDQEWFDFFDTLGGQAALAIQNAQLFDSLQRNNAELEFRVAERTIELNQANHELERANETKSEFLATMSHELRTPLNSVLGLSEMLLEQRRGGLNEYQSKSISTIHASGQHLLELINDVLDLSKIEAGKFDHYPQVVAVEALCRASLSFVKESALRKSITLRYHAELPVANIYADPRRLKQILVNLLTNAVKFTSEGGAVTLHVEQEVENDRIRFAVQDTGIGIALEDLKRLFQPFVQVDSRLTREHEGTGLGLVLVQRLADLHGGSVSVESEVGKGSRFTVNLSMGQALVAQQIALDSAGEMGIIPIVSTEPASQPLEHGSILLAEDNMSNVLTVGDYLEGHGYTVHVAHDGAEALERAQAQPHDLILMDIQMPVMDGLEAIQRLRKDSHFDQTPIIALTALAMPGDRERCLEAGANEYISKPVSLKSLLQTVRVFLNAGRQNALRD